MTKKQLLEMLDRSVLKSQSGTKHLYDTYYPRIENLLEFVEGDNEIKNVSALDKFQEKYAFDNFVRDNKAEEIEIILRGMESGIRDWVRNFRETIDCNSYKSMAAGNEVSKYVTGKSKRKTVSIVLLALFGCGAAITILFAFLDNFHVIDYGDTAAGAAGIIDFAVGVVAFIVERVNDWKTTRTMKAAEKVYDGESYKNYTNITIKGKNTKLTVIDKVDTFNN